MKFFISIILTALLSYTLCLFLPWWAIALAAFATAFMVPLQKPWMAFIAGFAGVFGLWFILSYVISSANGHELAHMVSTLVLKSDSPMMIILVTALIGGLVGGFAALAGAQFRKLMAPNTAI